MPLAPELAAGDSVQGGTQHPHSPAEEEAQMAMKSRLVFAVMALAALGSVPAPAQEAPLPDRQADLSPTPPALVRHRGPSADSPLVLVDGVPRRSLAAYLDDPEDVESIDIIKPAEAVERYGEAARHGAVLIRLRPFTAETLVRTGPSNRHMHYETCLPIMGLERGATAGEVCVQLVPRRPSPGIRIRGSSLAANP